MLQNSSSHTLCASIDDLLRSNQFKEAVTAVHKIIQEGREKSIRLDVLISVLELGLTLPTARGELLTPLIAIAKTVGSRLKGDALTRLKDWAIRFNHHTIADALSV